MAFGTSLVKLLVLVTVLTKFHVAAENNGFMRVDFGALREVARRPDTPVMFIHGQQLLEAIATGRNGFVVNDTDSFSGDDLAKVLQFFFSMQCASL